MLIVFIFVNNLRPVMILGRSDFFYVNIKVSLNVQTGFCTVYVTESSEKFKSEWAFQCTMILSHRENTVDY